MQNMRSNDSNPYHQHALHQGDFRLLLLQPSKDYDAPIHCDLEVWSLQSDGLAYDALSYTWGPPWINKESEPREVNFCQRRMPIRENLFFALCQLRYQCSVRALWVDALCIDQENKSEKTEQVTMMSNIYFKATRVIAWLGIESERYDGFVGLAFLTSLLDFQAERQRMYNTTFPDLIPERVSRVLLSDGSKLRTALSTLSCAYTSSGSFEAALWASMDPEVRDSITEGSLEVAFAWHSLIWLLRRNYFSRLWVLQEIYHAREALVICGGAEMLWEAMKTAISMAHDVWPFFSHKYRDFRRSGPFRLDEALSKDASAQNGAASLLLLRMSKFADSHCKDSRDKAYALLSFSTGPPCLRPRYTVPVVEVWIEFACALVNEGRTGWILELATQQLSKAKSPPNLSGKDGLPSWVPDFGGDWGYPGRSRDTLFYTEPLGKSDFVEDGEHNILNCTLLYWGEVFFLRGYALISHPSVRDMHWVHKTSFLPTIKQGDKLGDEFHDSVREHGIPIITNYGEARPGDIVCSVDTRIGRRWLIVLRRTTLQIDFVVSQAHYNANAPPQELEKMNFRIR